MQASLSSQLDVEILELGSGLLAAHEAEWRDLERRSAFASPYVGFDWLSAWASVYRPPSLKLFRLTTGDGTVQALGLVEVGKLGRLSFAGAPISPHRGLLCAAELEKAAWQELARHLSTCSYRWVTLDTEGESQAAMVLPRARTTVVPFLSIELPRTFDEYLEGSPGRKRWVMRNLRLLDKAGGLVRPSPNAANALTEFVRLHQERALAKHERHPQIEPRLATMLEQLTSARSIELVVYEVILREKTLGVAVCLAYGSRMFGYNLGIATSERSLSPGILLAIASIRGAVDRGLKCLDLGSGEYPYKVKLGGVSVDHFDVVASSKSLRSTVIATALVSLRKGRSIFGRNRLRQLADRVSHSR